MGKGAAAGSNTSGRWCASSHPGAPLQVAVTLSCSPAAQRDANASSGNGDAAKGPPWGWGAGLDHTPGATSSPPDAGASATVAISVPPHSAVAVTATLPRAALAGGTTSARTTARAAPDGRPPG